FDGDQHQQQRRRVPFAGLDDGEMPTAIVIHRRNESPEKPVEWVSFGMDLAGSLYEELDAGIDEESSEEVCDPGKLVQERGAEHDEDGAHGERTEDPPEEHAVLELGRNCKDRENDDEDE